MIAKCTQQVWRAGGSRCAAFTLIEMLAVMVLIGLVASAAILRFSGVTGPARTEWAVGRLTNIESALRTHAADHSEVASLEVELGSDRLTRSVGEERGTESKSHLGQNIRIVRFLSGSREVSSGRVVIDYSALGQSETFALELDQRGSGRSVWLVFAGLTGQVTRFQEERDARQLIRVSGAARPDAD